MFCLDFHLWLVCNGCNIIKMKYVLNLRKVNNSPDLSKSKNSLHDIAIINCVFQTFLFLQCSEIYSVCARSTRVKLNFLNHFFYNFIHLALWFRHCCVCWYLRNVDMQILCINNTNKLFSPCRTELGNSTIVPSVPRDVILCIK